MEETIFLKNLNQEGSIVENYNALFDLFFYGMLNVALLESIFQMSKMIKFFSYPILHILC